MDPRLTQVGPTREAAKRLAEEERKRKEAQALLAAQAGIPMWDPQASQLPTMTTTAQAPDALAVRLARLERPEFEGVPAVTRDRPGVAGTLEDMAIQVPAAAASMVSRFGEGALRRLEDIPRVGEYFGRGADAIKANADVVREVTAPKTTEGKAMRGLSDLGVSALPYVAAGGGALGLLRSAAMTGIESATDEGSMVKGMADLTGSKTLQDIADSPYRAAVDVGSDMAFNLIPGVPAAYRAVTKGVDDATQGVTGLERMRAGAQQMAANTRSYAGELGRNAMQAIQDNPRMASAAMWSLAGFPVGGLVTDPFLMGSVMPVARGSSARNLPAMMGQSVLPVEALPGNLWDVNTVEGIAESTPRTRALFSEDQLPAMKPLLEEVDTHFNLSDDAKLNQKNLNFGLGSYEGSANINAQVTLPEQVTVKFQRPKVDEAGEVLLDAKGNPVMESVTETRTPTKLEKDAVARALAVLQRQNAVPWMTPIPLETPTVMELAKLPAKEARAIAEGRGLPTTGLVVIPIPKAMKAGQAEAIAQTLQNAGVEHSFTQVQNKQGAFLVFGNFTADFGKEVSDAQLLREVTGALNGTPVWEKVAPGTIQPYFARSNGNYLGGANEAEHLDELVKLIAEAEKTNDYGAASLARKLADFLDRNTNRIRAGQEQVDRAYQPAAVFDRGVLDELRAGGVTPVPGLDAPYNARGLHPSMLERGDPSVPLLDAAGKPTEGPVIATTSGANIDRSLAAIDRAFEAVPNPVLDADDYKKWGSMLFGPVIPRRPTLPAELAASVEELRPLLARLDEQTAQGPARPRSQMGRESDAGLEMSALFDQAYKQGTANPVTSLMLYSWGNLSKMASVAPHETAFLDLMFAKNGDSLQPILERVSRGEYTKADEAQIRSIAEALPEGAFSRQVKNNINALAKDLGKMAQPVPGGRMIQEASGQMRPETYAERWHELLADRSLTDEQFMREFQRSFADVAVGMDTKVVSFIALVTGRRNLLVPDRVQTALQWQAPKTFANSDLASNLYGKSGLPGLFKGAQGVAMQEALQRGLTPSLEKLYIALGRPGQGDIGRYHWETWVASSDQEVGHGSIDLIRDQASGRDISKGTALVKEGQLDKFRYGEIQGVLNGERVFGFITSDGRQFVVPREDYLQLQAQFKKLAPKKFEISKNTAQPYFMVEGYPTDMRDALIMQNGIEVPPPTPDAIARGQMEQARQADQQSVLSQMAQRPAAQKTPTSATKSSGGPIRVFHATDADFTSPRAGTMFTTNRRYADDFAENMRGAGRAGRVREAELQIANPADLRALNMSPSDFTLEDMQRLQSMGYDGAQYRDEAFIIFDPAQAKMLEVPDAGSVKRPKAVKRRSLRDIL